MFIRLYGNWNYYTFVYLRIENVKNLIYRVGVEDDDENEQIMEENNVSCFFNII